MFIFGDNNIEDMFEEVFTDDFAVTIEGEDDENGSSGKTITLSKTTKHINTKLVLDVMEVLKKENLITEASITAESKESISVHIAGYVEPFCMTTFSQSMIYNLLYISFATLSKETEGEESTTKGNLDSIKNQIDLMRYLDTYEAGYNKNHECAGKDCHECDSYAQCFIGSEDEDYFDFLDDDLDEFPSILEDFPVCPTYAYNFLNTMFAKKYSDYIATKMTIDSGIYPKVSEKRILKEFAKLKDFLDELYGAAQSLYDHTENCAECMIKHKGSPPPCLG